jgi:hypothetical protein
MVAQLLIPSLVAGFRPANPGVSTLAINAAANWAAFSFIAQSSAKISKCRFFFTAKNGTLSAGDITCDLYSSASGVPNASLESRNTTTAAYAGSAWNEFTGFTTTLVAGTMYWLVLKNVNGTPATNNVTVGNVNGLDAITAGGTYGFGRNNSTNSGGSWPNARAQVGGVRVDLNDGTYLGFPASNSAASGNLVYATRELGAQFVTPSAGVLRVAGLAALVTNKVGTPAGNVRLGLWSGASPANLDYTNDIPNTDALASLGGWVCGLLKNGVQVIQPGTTLTVTLADQSGNSDSAANCWKGTELTVDSDSHSLAQIPWSMQEAYYNGSAWSLTNTLIVPFGLILDTAAGELGAGGGTNVFCSPRRITVQNPGRPQRRPAAVIVQAPVVTVLRTPPRTAFRPTTPRRAIPAAVLAAPPVIVPLRVPVRQLARQQSIRRNAGSALFSSVTNNTVLISSPRKVR